MSRHTLGSGGPSVSALGIGTWAWGDQLFWNYGKNYGASEVAAAFEAAVNAGVTFFDTAEVYGFGESETLLGQFIKQNQHSIDVATKFLPLPWRFSSQAVAEALTASLDRLQLERVALYQVHSPFTFFMSQESLMNALANEVEKGRIQSIGVSNYAADEMRQAHQILSQRGIQLAVNQVQYSLLSRQVESKGILAAARELDITILAYSPLAQGLLTGKYTPAHPPDGARRLSLRFSTTGLQKIAPVLELLRQIGDRYEKTPAQVALNWLITQGTVPIPGAKTAAQAAQNAGALGWSINRAEIAQLEQATRPWLD
ncbi:MAG: aldo/keto reductase [Cyanophyceae cyanobacterium]